MITYIYLSRYKKLGEEKKGKKTHEMFETAISTMRKLRLKRMAMEAEDSSSKEMLTEMLQTQKSFCESISRFEQKQEEQNKQLLVIEAALEHFERRLDILLNACMLRKQSKAVKSVTKNIYNQEDFDTIAL